MKTKCAALAILISLAFASQAFPVLRPLFPIKPAAPSNGELIVIGDNLVLPSAKKPMLHHRGSGTVASAWTAGYGLCHEGCPVRRNCDATRGMPWSHEPGNVIETHEQKGHFVERKPFRRHQLYSRHRLTAGL